MSWLHTCAFSTQQPGRSFQNTNHFCRYLLKTLSWLPTELRMKFKLSNMANKARHDPGLLASPASFHTPGRECSYRQPHDPLLLLEHTKNCLILRALLVSFSLRSLRGCLLAACWLHVVLICCPRLTLTFSEPLKREEPTHLPLSVTSSVISFMAHITVFFPICSLVYCLSPSVESR